MSAGDVTIQAETLTDSLIAEIVPLGRKCWAESTIAKGENCAGERDLVIDPNLAEFRKLSDVGALVIIVIRAHLAAQGYVLGFTYRALHHQSVLGAIADTFYVEPEYRAYAGVMVDMFVNELKTRNVNMIGWPVTPGSYGHQLLLARGFVADDVVMEKTLCV
jgi:hypothetical protein